MSENGKKALRAASEKEESADGPLPRREIEQAGSPPPGGAATWLESSRYGAETRRIFLIRSKLKTLSKSTGCAEGGKISCAEARI
ncbi:MAG: hypothetical protein BGO12_21150 [Verrucomicrobia bacterium 61-8]|nr:MAG: hypothetical protein BGO12_21150 [Verrucomicrobia bacterium 61-8]